ncbi:MAG TPA: hypothetical protein DEB05_07645 [Firmicutes bacterium]|nr:hypothetical protein [Bacillota bacterium]
MSKKTCLGCGMTLQYENPSLPGYIPPEKQKKALICQRCYQIRHYGKLKTEKVTDNNALESVRTAIRSSDLILLVVDVFDPEGSLPAHWRNLFTLPVVMVINKADLLPVKTPWDEIEEWFKTLWERKFPDLQLVAVQALSATKRGNNFQARLSALKEQLKGKKVAILGAANVGKTSLLTVLLTEEREKKKTNKIPTVSKFPGTTQGITSWLIRSHEIKLFDTPGLAPGSRMGDQLSPSWAGRLLPENKLQVKLWELPPQGAVLFGGLVGVWNLSPSPRTLLFFAAEKTLLHRSQGGKAKRLMDEAPDWLRAYCLKERPSKFGEKVHTVQPGKDLFISGLGWVAVKKEAVLLRVVAPVGVEIGTRPSLIGKKDN